MTGSRGEDVRENYRRSQQPYVPQFQRGAQWSWTPERAPAGPVTIRIEKSSQKMRVYRAGQLIGESDVATGKPGQETPSGSFTITQKKRRHFSNLYGQFVDQQTGQSVGVGRSSMTPPEGTRFEGSPMPWMQRLTDDGICIHAGRVLGYPASSGCIRVPEDFAPLVYSVTEVGTPVNINP